MMKSKLLIQRENLVWVGPDSGTRGFQQRIKMSAALHRLSLLINKLLPNALEFFISKKGKT